MPRCGAKLPFRKPLPTSLTENRDTFVLAQQFLQGKHRAMNSIYRVLTDLGIKMDLQAPTMTGQSWQERIADLDVPVDPSLGERAIIRTTPVRDASGVEVLHGNFMSSAIIKVAGMSNKLLQRFDDQLLVVRYYENEHICIDDISSPNLITILTEVLKTVPTGQLDQLVRYNSGNPELSYDSSQVYQLMSEGALSFAFVISGQGPRAFGMPEMFTPSQNLKHHQFLEPSSLLITDGRYSGVTKGACIGHVTPEAFENGGIGHLDNGDILHFCLKENRLDLIDAAALTHGKIISMDQIPERTELIRQRHERMLKRRLQIAASNLMSDVTNAEKGCIPEAVDERAVNPLPN